MRLSGVKRSPFSKRTEQKEPPNMRNPLDVLLLFFFVLKLFKIVLKYFLRLPNSGAIDV